MTSVIIQPFGSEEARAHYEATIANPVPLASIKSYLTQELNDDLNTIYPSGHAPTWGTTPAADNTNVAMWSRVRPGDIALFARDKSIVASATVTAVTRNPQLAVQLWDRNAGGQTWECMYFLDEIRPQSIDAVSFNLAAGYAPTNPFRRFLVMDEERSANVLAAFDLDSLLHIPDIDDQVFEEATAVELDPEQPLDGVGRIRLRREQAKLRRSLFGSAKVSQCGICGNQLPVDLLVAAHVKKRSRCTSDERRDVANIVMPMCKLGCDELFELGYISVEDAVVVASTQPTTPAVATAVGAIVGNRVNHWSTSSEPYFAWHREYSLRA